MDFILVAIGGGIGSVLRYFLSKILPLKIYAYAFPIGTFSVNLIGSFLIGFLGFLVAQKFVGEDFRVFFIVGVLGGFTTFSSFGLDTFLLLGQKEYLKALVYVLGTNILGFVLVIGGWWLSRLILNR